MTGASTRSLRLAEAVAPGRLATVALLALVFPATGRGKARELLLLGMAMFAGGPANRGFFPVALRQIMDGAGRPR